MNTTYKGHEIELNSDVIAGTARWNVKVVITWTEGDEDEYRRFYGPAGGFKSKPDAETWGLTFAQKWIDDGKPDIHKP